MPEHTLLLPLVQTCVCVCECPGTCKAGRADFTRMDGGGLGSKFALGKKGQWVIGGANGRPRPVLGGHFSPPSGLGALEFLTLFRKAQEGC